VALALARIVGDEHNFIQLLRQVRDEAGTTLSQTVTALKKRMGEYQADDETDLPAMLNDCAETLAREDLEQGVALLGGVIRSLPVEELRDSCAEILQGCAAGLDEFGAGRLEYAILALHTMQVGFSQRQIGILARALSIGGLDSN
jgi:hypothetical protein